MFPFVCALLVSLMLYDVLAFTHVLPVPGPGLFRTALKICRAFLIVKIAEGPSGLPSERSPTDKIEMHVLWAGFVLLTCFYVYEWFYPYTPREAGTRDD